MQGMTAHQVCCKRLPPAVPEGVHEDLVVLDGNWADCAVQVKGTALEHDTILIVDTGALREDE